MVYSALLLLIMMMAKPVLMTIKSCEERTRFVFSFRLMFLASGPHEFMIQCGEKQQASLLDAYMLLQLE